MSDQIVLKDVSKFYGEVLGVNRVDLVLEPGITSLVGPNGSGKTTLMNLMTGLLQPTRGEIHILGIPLGHPEALFRKVGYCTQFDTFPAGMTGEKFVNGFLRLHGIGRAESLVKTWQVLEQVGLEDAARRPIAGYSKGMRQRIKLAQAISHEPDLLILDEPLNGLDPMARSEIIALFQKLAAQGQHVLISSHILHEVNMISDAVVLLKGGYVVAEGAIDGVRTEVSAQPLQVLIRCARPGLVASRLFEHDHVSEVQIHEDRAGLLVRTRDADSLYLLMNQLVVEEKLVVDQVAPADDDVQAVYKYLIEGDAGGAA